MTIHSLFGLSISRDISKIAYDEKGISKLWTWNVVETCSSAVNLEPRPNCTAATCVHILGGGDPTATGRAGRYVLGQPVAHGHSSCAESRC